MRYWSVMCPKCGNVQGTTATGKIRCLGEKCGKVFSFKNCIKRGPFDKPRDVVVFNQLWLFHIATHSRDYADMFEDFSKKDVSKDYSALEARFQKMRGITFRIEELSDEICGVDLARILDNTVAQGTLVKNPDGSFTAPPPVIEYEEVEQPYIEPSEDKKPKRIGRVKMLSMALEPFKGRRFIISDIPLLRDEKVLRLFLDFVTQGNIMEVSEGVFTVIAPLDDDEGAYR